VYYIYSNFGSGSEQISLPALLDPVKRISFRGSRMIRVYKLSLWLTLSRHWSQELK